MGNFYDIFGTPLNIHLNMNRGEWGRCGERPYYPRKLVLPSYVHYKGPMFMKSEVGVKSKKIPPDQSQDSFQQLSIAQ